MEDNSFKETLKTNTTFGSVKIFQMVIALLKTKVTAVFLGPIGLGIFSLLNTTIFSLESLTNCGVPQSSVREISCAKNRKSKSNIIASANYLSLILGIVGCLICLILSSQLSLLAFGNVKYKLQFQILSSTIFFDSIANTQISIFQGLRKVRLLARSSLIGAILSLIICIPLYYYYNIKAIPYVIVMGQAVIMVVYLLGNSSLNRVYRISFKIRSIGTYNSNAKPILQLGIVLMISNGIMMLFSLILNIIINNKYGQISVGLYQAALTCINSVISILIAIMTSDYYPRLARVIDNKEKLNNVVNTQFEIFIFCVTPMILVLILFPSFVVSLLFSDKFLSIVYILQIMGLSLLFRVMWHSLSFVILAEGDKKRYFLFDSLLGNGSFFLFNFFGVYFYNLKGLAISYLLGAILMCFILYVLTHKFYFLTFSKRIYITFSVLFLLSSFVLLSNILLPHGYKIIFEFFFSFIIICYIMIMLQKRISYISYIKDKFSSNGKYK